MQRYPGSARHWLLLAALFALIATGCGKKEEETPKQGSSLIDIAKQAAAGSSLDSEAGSLKAKVEGAGFVALAFDPFPGPSSGKVGRVLVYADEKGRRGGVIYATKVGTNVEPCRHWDFDDMAPDSVQAVELNDDGLWDIRVMAGKGREMDLFQDKSFTLDARERSDWIALNGQSSPAISEDDELWKCFDGDSATAWRSSMSNGTAFVELWAPFGVESGVLSITSGETDQPRSCVVYADGKKIQDLKLRGGAGTQVMQLEDGVRGARKIRLEFAAVHGGASNVAIAELSLK